MKLRRHRDTVPPSRLERRVLLFWHSFGGPELKREFRFLQTRKWRSDFAHHDSRPLAEIEGGLYIRGRQNRLQRFAACAEMCLKAAPDG